MESNQQPKPREIQGISYYYPSGGHLSGRDGKVSIPLGDIPLPLLKEDFSGEEPSYDAVGRGIYQFLRLDPDSPFADRYAVMLRDAYPHLFAEMATHLVMLDKKDVDLPYLDRKINYLKIFALLEPENYRFPLEIGSTYLAKAFTLAALGNTTVLLFAALKHLGKAHRLNPGDVRSRFLSGEVAYLLGKYDDTLRFWCDIDAELPAAESEAVRCKIDRIKAGDLPAVPLVDYLQVVGVALEAYEAGDYEEAAAIILDVLDVVAELEGFPLAEVSYLLGLCYVRLDMPRYAEQYLQEALRLRPGYEEAQRELEGLGV